MNRITIRARRRVAALAGIGAACVALVAAVFAAYRLPDTSPVTRFVVNVLPLPAAEIGDRFISYKEYLESLDSSRAFYASQLGEGGFEQPSDSQVREQALERLLFDTVVRDLARERGVRLTLREVEYELSLRASHSGGWAQLSEMTRHLYGWSPRDYAHRYLTPALLYRALAEDVRSNDPDNTAARAKAQQAREEIQGGVDFMTAAGRYGSADTMETPGAIVAIDLSTQPEEIGAAVDGLAPGEVSDVLELEQSLQIVQLVDATDRSAVRIRRISFPLRTADDLITDRRTQETVHIFMHRY